MQLKSWRKAIGLCVVVIGFIAAAIFLNKKSAAASNCSHSYGSWVVDYPAGCTSKGQRHRICSKCKYCQTETIQPTGHNTSGKRKVVDATCTEQGYSVATCSKCNNESGARSYTNALGHSWNNWVTDANPTCTQGGQRHRICSRCRTSQSEALGALGHNTSGSTKTVAATCTAGGYSTPTCSRCGTETGSKTYTGALGHSWGNWINDANPTCTKGGQRHRICSRCKTSQSEALGALGHNTSGTKKTVAATCTANGYSTPTCSRCGTETGTKTTIAALGHSWDNWIVDSAPTCTKGGQRHRICSRCKTSQSEALGALGHNTSGSTKTVKATCTSGGYSTPTCSRCGTETGTKTTTAALGHSWNNWITDKAPTCTQTGQRHRICSRCNTSESEVMAALGHNKDGGTKTVKATCTMDGYTVATCSRCKSEVGTKTVITKLGHSWGSWVTDKAPNCTQTGQRHRICSRCNTGESEVMAALGHNKDGGTKTVKATCTTDGYTVATCSRCKSEVGTKTVITKLGHSWGSWVTDKAPNCTQTGQRHRICSRCNTGESEVMAALGHNKDGGTKTVKATCTKDGYTVATCSRCKSEVGTKTVITKLGHSWGSWVTDKAPTCTQTGQRHRICSRCNTSQSEVMDALGHNKTGGTKTVAATCTKDGYTVATCSRCKSEVGTKTVITKLGHNWGSWVTDVNPGCTTKGQKHRICSRCKNAQTQELAALGHNKTGGTKTVAATCTKDGYTVATCSRCNTEQGTKTVITKLGHSWGSWVTDVNPGCTAKGQKHRICSRCKNAQTQEIDALGHNKTGPTKTVAATCTKDGYKVATCSRCNTEQGTRTVITKLGHNWGAWVTDVAPGCTSKGQRHRICTRCKAAQTEEFGPAGHDTKGATKTVAATCTEDGYTVATCSRCNREQGTKKVIKALGHNWEAWVTDVAPGCFTKGQQHRICSRCKFAETEELEPVGHDQKGPTKKVDSTCTEDGYTVATCSRCHREQGDRTVIPAGHKWEEWHIDKAPACMTKGQKHRMCTACLKVETVVLDALGHDTNGKAKRKDATCEEDGYYIETCSKCGNEHGKKLTYLKTGHSWEDWHVDLEPACAQKGQRHRLCSKCRKCETEVLEALQHDNNGPIRRVNPTCTKSGYTVATCSKCGNERGGREWIVKLGHTWSEWDTVIEPACEMDGTKTRKCSVCGEIETLPIKQLGHSVNGQVQFIIDNPATLRGHYGVVCSRCGEEMRPGRTKSYVHVYLYPNFEGGKIIDANWHYPGEKLIATEIKGDEYPGHFLKGWMTSDGTTYIGQDVFTVPNADVVLYAIWGDNNYTIYYHNGFTGEMEYAQPVTGNTATLKYTPRKANGYTFVGWVEGKPDNAGLFNWGDGVGPNPFANEPDYAKNATITVNGDMKLYSCFEETPAPTDGSILVCYNALGGLYGPSDEYYKPGETYLISTKKPQKTGFEFAGWSTSVYGDKVEYVGGNEYKEPVYDNKVIFYAVWVPDTTNDLKHDLQTRFGKDKMPDSYFDDVYKSSKWEKVNDNCYFVINTTNFYGDNSPLKYMSSSVFIVEFKNGQWNLETHGVGMGIMRSFKFDIVTKNNNTVGRIESLIFDVSKSTISILCPALGTFITILDVASAAEDLYLDISSRDWSNTKVEDVKSVAYLSTKLADSLRPLIKEALKDYITSPTDLERALDIAIDTVLTASDLLLKNDISCIKDYLNRIMKAGRSLDQSYLDSLKIVTNDPGQDLVNGVLVKTSEELKKLDGLETIDLAAVGSKLKFNIFTTLVSFVVECATKDAKYGHTDPFSNYDDALGTFRDELPKHGFSQDVKAEFSDVLMRIVNANY